MSSAQTVVAKITVFINVYGHFPLFSGLQLNKVILAGCLGILSYIWIHQATRITFNGAAFNPAVYSIVAGVVAGLVAVSFHVDARFYDRSNDFDPKNPSQFVHEKTLSGEALKLRSNVESTLFRLVKGTGTRGFTDLSSNSKISPNRNAQLKQGDYIIHAEEINDLLPYRVGRKWNLILAWWKTIGESTSDEYAPELLEKSLKTMGYADAGEYLDAK